MRATKGSEEATIPRTQASVGRHPCPSDCHARLRHLAVLHNELPVAPERAVRVPTGDVARIPKTGRRVAAQPGLQQQTRSVQKCRPLARERRGTGTVLPVVGNDPGYTPRTPPATECVPSTVRLAACSRPAPTVGTVGPSLDCRRRRSRRTVPSSSPLRCATPLAATPSPARRRMASAAKDSARSTATRAWRRLNQASSRSRTASSIRCSRARATGSRARRRACTAFSLRSRARSRPAAALVRMLPASHRT